MSKAMREAIVDYVASTLEGTDSAVVVDSSRMTVAETEEFRSKLRDEDVHLFFLRNRLARIAFDKIGIGPLGQVLDGPSAIAFGGEGAIGISKLVVDETRKVWSLGSRGGIIDGEVLDRDGVIELSKLPGKKGLQSMVLVAMFGPVSDFAASMDNLLTEMHGLIEALHDKREKEG